jgi:anti-sigma factor RsiW
MQHPNHPDHDLTFIAAHAAGDLPDSERTRADILLATCVECADVHRDLIAIAAATRSLPNLASAPRDFRLSPEQSARLRRTGFLRTILAPLGATRSATRPLAAAFTSLGIAGLLVATVVPGLMGSAASQAGTERDRTNLGAAAATSAPAAPPAVPVSGPGQPAASDSAAKPDSEFGVKDGGSASSVPGGVLSGAATAPPQDTIESHSERVAATTPNPVFIGSLVLLVVGLLLFGLRFAGRRLR